MIHSADYRVELHGSGPKSGKLESISDGLPALEVASPPEFGGPEGVWSPEHLLVASVSSCLMTTFHAMAAMSGVEVIDYQDEAVGRLERGEEGLYRIETIFLRPRVVIKDETRVDRARRLLSKAESVCLIGRSVSSETVLEPVVTALGD